MRRIRQALLLIPLTASVALAQEPGRDWLQFASPEDAGFESASLDGAYQRARQLGSAAVWIVRGGHVVAAWGAVEHPYRTHSMRKSLYSVTFGAASEGDMDLEATLDEMGVSDLGGLDELERSATVANLLRARSGVYHNAAYETPSNASRRPERSSAAPGERWYYNNWDFNALPTIFRKQTGQTIADALVERIARKVGMQDLQPERDIFEWLEPSVSVHPAILIRISARDLARVGQLVLDGGLWAGERILPAAWIAESTRAHTSFPDGHHRGVGNGYGYLWWIFPASPDAKMRWQRVHRIAALGAGGHAMFIVPELDLVIVHRTDTDRGRGIGDRDGAALMDMIVQAITGDTNPEAVTVPVRPLPLGEAPERLERHWRAVPADEIRALAGRYEDGSEMWLELFEHDGRLFTRRESSASSEAELFASKDGRFLSPIAPLWICVLENDEGRALELEVWFRGQTMTLTRTGD